MAAITAQAKPERRHAARSPTLYGLMASGHRLNQEIALMKRGVLRKQVSSEILVASKRQLHRHEFRAEDIRFPQCRIPHGNLLDGNAPQPGPCVEFETVSKNEHWVGLLMRPQGGMPRDDEAGQNSRVPILSNAAGTEMFVA